MNELPEQFPEFDFSGERLCLDFANTLADRMEAVAREKLQSYGDLVAWGLQATILTEDDVQHLLKKAARSPEEAALALQQAIATREVIYRVFKAIVDDIAPEENDLVLLNAALSSVMGHARVVRAENRFAWDWVDKRSALVSVIWPVVRSAADILTSDEIDGVKMCAAEDCGWLFLDTSKNRSRRWCDMRTCGNRSKVRRHYERKKQPYI